MRHQDQSYFRQRIKRQSLVVWALLLCALAPAAWTLERAKLAGRNVAIWRPPQQTTKPPLILFSHGFRGINTQSAPLMRELAQAGYLVVAPNHKDYLFGSAEGPQESFDEPDRWTEQTYRDRADDLLAIHEAVKHESNGELILMGHSLGGYTALGLAGAWPGWTGLHPQAVVAFSPYLTPYTVRGNLAQLKVPVMYQGGTKDLFITPHLSQAFEQTGGPKAFVNFLGAGHGAWTTLDRSNHAGILSYTLRFLRNEPLPAKTRAIYELKASGLTDLPRKSRATEPTSRIM